MEKIVYAKFKNCLISAQKVRLVADLIRNKKIDQAESILLFTNKTASRDILKTLNSAIANAVNNDGLDRKTLYVREIFVDEAQTYKRGRPAARGRYRSILKRNCHITIGLKSMEEKKVIEKEEKVVEEVSKNKPVKKTSKISNKVNIKK